MVEAKQYTVHMIGNAHIDHAWLWRWPEAKEEVLSTCRAALERMDETPDFTFSFSSALSYKWIEEEDPALFEEIRRRVAEGRWNIVGGWWVQPDCNIPCGESLVRQALYGLRYVRQKFGVEVPVGYHVDSFGHCAALPQILRKCGQRYYLFFRPDPEFEIQLPYPVFWWEGGDGSRVLACRPPLHYNTGPDNIEGQIWAAYLKTPPGLRDVLCFYGVGNHGGGPTKANIAAIESLAGRAEAPQVVFSTPERFFRAALARRGDFPTWRHELQHHARGCYTAVSAIKRHNRRAENLLLCAEKFAALAHFLCRCPYPQAELTKAWQNVLFNQFHDILPGSSIPEVYDDAYQMYAETYHLAGKALEEALRALAERIDTRGPGRALVVFNPLAWERRGPVEVPLGVGIREWGVGNGEWWRRGASLELESGEGQVHILDEQGREVPSQLVTDGKDGKGRTFLLFLAGVPALGYRVYRVVPGESQLQSNDTLPTSNFQPPTSNQLDNARWRLEVDGQEGYITSLYDKRYGVEILAGPGASPVVLDDPSDTWSHGVVAYRDEIGRFGQVQVEVIERGPVRAGLRLTSRFNNSTLRQDIFLYRDLDYVEIRLCVDWHEQWRMLKLSFPCRIASPTATYETPYGHTVRPSSGEEEPGQRWVDVTGVIRDDEGVPLPYGLALLNDCKYGFSVQGPGLSEFREEAVDVRLSVLRSPLYAYHEDAPLPWGPEKMEEFTDQGEQSLTVALLPHAGPWPESHVPRHAEALNSPFIALPEPTHEGDYPPVQPFATVEPANVCLTVLKKAEDEEALILRFYETAGRKTTARIQMPYLDWSWEGPIGRGEIRTLKVSGPDPSVVMRETDLLERDYG